MVNDYKEKVGGAEIYLWNLKEALEANGHYVKIYGSAVQKEAYFLTHKNQTIKRYLMRIFNPKTFFEIRDLVAEFKPDIIHMHNILNEITPTVLLATKNIPVVMTVHDNMLVNAVSILSDRSGKECKKRTCGGCRNCVGWKGAIYEFVKRKILRQLLKRVKLYITPSKYMNELIQEAGFKPVIIIPNGIKLFEYSKITNFNTLLYVGRLAKEKGVEYLLRAMPEIIKSFPDVKLNLVGDGPDKEYFKDLAEELKIMKNVNFVGNIDRENIKKYYKDATIATVPSIYPDNFPTVCIEAMSVGRPIIGNSVGGIPELIDHGKTGYVLTDYSFRELSDKIIKLLKSKKQILEMSVYANQKSYMYSLGNHAERIENLYRKIIN